MLYFFLLNTYFEKQSTFNVSYGDPIGPKLTAVPAKQLTMMAVTTGNVFLTPYYSHEQETVMYTYT